MKRETVQRVATPTAILVGLAEALAEVCTDALGDAGLRVLRVGHVAAASERIPVVMPQLVVVPTTLRADDLDVLSDRCVAVGAEVVKVAPGTPHQVVATQLARLGHEAIIRALRSGRV